MCLVCGSCRGPASALRGNCRAESGVWGNDQFATDVWQHALMGSHKWESVDILEQLKACLEMQCDVIVAIDQHCLHGLSGCLRNVAP